jgi:hypothetical protein
VEEKERKLNTDRGRSMMERMCKQSGVKTEDRRRENEKGSEEESSKFKLCVPQVLLFLPPSSATGSNVLTITNPTVRHQPFPRPILAFMRADTHSNNDTRISRKAWSRRSVPLSAVECGA